MKTGENAIAAADEFDMDAINALPRFDAANQLDSDEEIVAYLNVYLEEEDVAMFVHGLGTVARARSKTGTATGEDVNHDTQYKALREEGAPRLETVMGMMKSLGLRLVVEGTAISSTPSGKTFDSV